MKLLFQSINLETMEEYSKYWKHAAQKSSDYSTGVLLCWERALGYEIAFEEDEGLAWIRGREPFQHYLAPVGRWEHADWEDLLRARFEGDVAFQLVPEALVGIWREQLGDAAEISENRDSWEYLHSVAELAELSGNKYMRKRNRINQFAKQNPYTYIPITEEHIPRIVAFQQEWCESYQAFGNAQSIARESEGIVRNILGNWTRLPQLLGGAIEVLGEIAAYTVAEAVDDDLLMIHFEKASIAYNAAYQVINHDFLRHEGARFKTVNREEDMGDPGLRDAKMSYHPTDFVKKYTVKIRL